MLNLINLIHTFDKGVKSAAIDDSQDDKSANHVQFVYSYSNNCRY